MEKGAIVAILVGVLVLVLVLSSLSVGASATKTPPVPAPVPRAVQADTGGLSKGVGAPLADPAQGGKCALDRGRAKACGAVNCPALPSCPQYKWMGMDKFVVGKLGSGPTGITNKSPAIAGGLDPRGVLDIVNAMRAKVGSPPVVWDDRLACAAAAWIPLTNYDSCAHGAAPGFPFYAQVIGASNKLTATPMETAKYAIEEQFFKQEKEIADKAKVAPNTAAQLQPGWKRGTISDTVIDGIGHYIILTSAEVRACGFSYGANYTKSRYISPPQTRMMLCCGHFAA